MISNNKFYTFCTINYLLAFFFFGTQQAWFSSQLVWLIFSIRKKLLFLSRPVEQCSHFLLNALINRTGGVLGLAMACSNTFGLVTGAFLLGFGLSEIPKSIWRNADWTTRQKVLSHKIAKMAVKLDDAHQELSNAIVVSLFNQPPNQKKVVKAYFFPFLLL